MQNKCYNHQLESAALKNILFSELNVNEIYFSYKSKGLLVLKSLVPVEKSKF